MCQSDAVAAFFVNQILCLDEKDVEKAWRKNDAVSHHAGSEREGRLAVRPARRGQLLGTRLLATRPRANAAPAFRRPSHSPLLPHARRRVQYLSWRAWHMRREKALLAAEAAAEHAASEATEHTPTERDCDTPTATECDDDTPGRTPTASPRHPRLSGGGFGEPLLYVVLLSVHGRLRGQHMELGIDADTGAQRARNGGWVGIFANRRI